MEGDAIVHSSDRLITMSDLDTYDWMATFKASHLPEPIEVISLVGGRNNRIFRVRTGEEDFLVKQYYRSSTDTRDRLRHEFEFLEYAWSQNLKNVPKPIYRDDINGVGVYSYIQGEKYDDKMVGHDAIEQAADFILKLNQNREGQDGKHLLTASEATFTCKDCVHVARQRVERLMNVASNTEVDRECVAFINEALVGKWVRCYESVETKARELDLWDEELKDQYRIISPSDVGFHNALCDQEARASFLDFEYAGWDDPVKLVCDFMNQGDYVIPDKFGNLFLQRVADGLWEDACWFHQRYDLIAPIHRIKMACTFLNEFLESAQDRRVFSGTIQQGLEQRKQIQLNKANQLLQRV